MKYLFLILLNFIMCMQISCMLNDFNGEYYIDDQYSNIEYEERKITTTENINQERYQVIGSNTTPLTEKGTSRLSNIKLASKSINNVILEPGEEFSFNKIIGKRTIEKGYKKAPILVKGQGRTQKSYGVGGGICQVSSTIYKAAKNAGLEITERHGHTKKVFYTNIGDDATVAYPTTDLKFKNNRLNNVMIKVKVEEDKIKVDILENK